MTASGLLFTLVASLGIWGVIVWVVGPTPVFFISIVIFVVAGWCAIRRAWATLLR